jgi:TonB-linked outer membrane protein, SusC/RagA family
MTKQLFAKAATIVMIFAASLLGMSSALAQNPAIRGKVVDSSNAGVIGAAVLVPGTTNGVQTDLDGNFEIRVAPGTTLEVSCIGYTTKRVAAAANMVVVLEDDAEMLEETVVIGYGVQRKSDLTGAVASVRSADLENRSTTDAAAALQGKAAGVQILNTSGAPGSGASIRVRGYSSNSGNIGPLLIVDGLKVDNIQYLDPSLIESMEILKDAASAAIYGAQAGNGVVLITTKTGAANNGTAHITYNGRFTLQSLGKKAELFGGDEYVEYMKAIGQFDDDLLNTNGWHKGMNYNWFDAVFAPSWSIQNGITFQGGNNKGHFFLALNHLDNDGIVVGKKDVYKRLSAQINADYQLFKWFNISTNTSFEKWSRTNVSESSYGSMLNSVMSLDPLTPAYYSKIEDCATAMQQHYNMGDPVPTDPNHNNDFYATSKYLEESTGNPLFQRDRTDSTNGGISVRGGITANLTPIAGLVITSRFGYRIAQSSSHSYSAPYWLTGMASSTEYNISANVNTNYYYQWENFANYNKSFGKHNIGIMAGMSYIESNNDNASISSSGTDILSGYEPNFRYINYVKSDAKKNIGNAPGRSANLSYYGRLSYNFDNRYSIQANFRADAFDSSKLSQQARWGYFPSVSVGWTISNEPFFKDNVSRNAISFLKIRGSWGRNGNVNVLSGYQYSTTIALNGEWYQYDAANATGPVDYGSMPSGLANPNLKWETSEQYDAGIDARFLNNRLTFTFDWYRKITRDLLVSINPIPEIGVSSTYINAGDVLNTGLEFELGWKDTIGDFSYSINGNFSTLHNEVLSMPSAKTRIEGTTGGVSGLNNKIRTAFEPGYPIWYFRGYKYAGVTAEGTPQYYNAKGDIVDVVEEGDLQYIGKAIPDATYGITISLAWKGIDFSVFGTGVIGSNIFSLLYSADRPRTNTLTYFWHNSVGNPNATGNTFPDMAKVSNDWKFWSSSASLFKGDYFKIKQIQLGYTLPQNITKKALISNLRIFVSLDDYFTFSSYPGCDPETATTGASNGMGYDAGTYPTTKKCVFGVNLTF